LFYDSRRALRLEQCIILCWRWHVCAWNEPDKFPVRRPPDLAWCLWCFLYRRQHARRVCSRGQSIYIYISIFRERLYSGVVTTKMNNIVCRHWIIYLFSERASMSLAIYIYIYIYIRYSRQGPIDSTIFMSNIALPESQSVSMSCIIRASFVYISIYIYI
jgi:hypothetical protein